ncbi:uncharacterized protein LOC117946234 isoform X2 [Etheostoma cragini]|uniref:uncharacterized protein LOC117946234 isoform X2 n=1 Tax=Etheostoma cragini TaxID=417921 RepID=UPI00155E9FF2|nr:uncharacterized protein LOC117946234 isoform X2 [Etheostoma cragini]
MLCSAAVSAAAAAVWLLAMLGPGLSLPAENNSGQGFSLCSHCFYRQTPPQGVSARSLLRSFCHRLPGGQAFATLSKPTCDTAVYSAFHLSHGWTEKKGEEGKELVTEEEEHNIKVAVPALLRGGMNPSHAPSPTDPPLQHWDSTVSTLVQSSITPQCSTLGGDLYILTGVGGFGASEDEDKECQTKPLWSAMCCAVPDGKSGFSMGLIRETGQEERHVISEERVVGESSADYEAVDEQETETNSSSTLVYVLSTTMSILTAPLQPVFSRVTQLPGQVTYVLQEDLGVLSALPGETYSLLHLLTSDLLSWMGLAGETLQGIGENCFASVYYGSSSMLGALLNSCETGVTGMGTLAGDTMGIFCDALDNAWWVTKFFGGRLWEQIECYIGTVLLEMGGQVKAVGRGVEMLAFRSGNGVGNVFKLGGGIITGMMGMVIGDVKEAFGQESD